MLDVALSALHILTHLILKTNLWGRNYYYPQVKNKEFDIANRFYLVVIMITNLTLFHNKWKPLQFLEIQHFEIMFHHTFFNHAL